MSPRRPTGPLRRTRSETQRPEIHIFVEGEKTEDGYLLPWRRTLRDRVLVTVDKFRGAAPLSLVQRAVQTKREGEREEARGRGRAYDEIWCVFDRDAHPNVDEAIELAAGHGIGIVMSNPCIELWFILHFEDQTAHIERKEAQRRSAELLRCEKTLTSTAAETLMANHEQARRRAKALDKKHVGDNSLPRSNPSSDVWRLVDRMSSIGTD